jgi:hypothetical protein
VIAPPRAVLFEIVRLDLVIDEVLAGRRIYLDRTGRRDVIGGDGVEEQAEDARVDRLSGAELNAESYSSAASANSLNRE